MSHYAYDRLTFLDNSFLIMEREHTPMHIAGTATYDAAPLTKPDGTIDIDRIRAYIESRLHLIPRYRQRLQTSWVKSAPVWVDYDHFNIHYHVRHTALPKPGDARQLKRLAARIQAQHLDRSKPLWEIWVVEGLDDGNRIAMISKIHHCMVDGVSSVDLLNVLLTPVPIEDFPPAEKYLPRPAPSELDLALETIGELARMPFELGKNVSELASQVQDPLSDVRTRFRALREMLGTGFGVSDTPLNKSVGPHRRFDWLKMSLAEIKVVKNQLGGTLNDVVLATVAGAVKRFLERHDMNTEMLDFRVMAPVSVRSKDERGALGNRVSGWIVPMPLGERDAKKRLDHIRETTAHLKEAKQAVGAEMLTQVGEWTPTTILSLASRMAARALPFNLVVTNVPGPQVPLYMLGARMHDNFGFLPLLDGLCLGIVLFSYSGSLCWGFTCDWDLLPDLHDFVLDIQASFQELKDAGAEAQADVEARAAMARELAQYETADAEAATTEPGQEAPAESAGEAAPAAKAARAKARKPGATIDEPPPSETRH